MRRAVHPALCADAWCDADAFYHAYGPEP